MKGLRMKRIILIKGKRPDIELREGDVVFVPESIF